MTPRLLLPALIAGALLTGAAAAPPAMADDDCPRQAGQWLTPTQVTDMLVAQGYQGIRKIERDDGCYEVKARDGQGRRVELKIEPVSGRILDRDHDDDD